MPQITKRLEFDAGHRVLGHEGRCKLLHGHRYAAEITVRAPHLDGLGRVVDFSVIKEKVGGWIDLHWDHNVLLHPDDPLLDYFAKHPPMGYIMPNNPTAENIAEFLYWKSKALLEGPHDELEVVRVRLYETPTSSAVFPDE